MKPVEEAFSSTTFRRVILPGIILTVGLHPILSKWLLRLETTYGVPAGFLLIVEVIFFGLVVSSAIQWIYYVYEGYRLSALTAVAGHLNVHKVQRLQDRRNEIQAGRSFDELSVNEQSAVSRIYDHLNDFPLRRTSTDTVERYAERPTRLGNIIATYELYAESRYGVDGVQNWYHLLNMGPDSARREFDEKYSFAESLVMTSFAGALVCAVHVLSLASFVVGRHMPPVMMVPYGPSEAAWLIVFGAIIWYLFYRAALPAHRDAGAIFRSIVDAALPEFLKWVESVEAPISRDRKERIEEVTEYLKALNE